MEFVNEKKFLRGRQGEIVIKELSIAAKDVLHTIHFRVHTTLVLAALRRTDSIGMMAIFLTTIEKPL